MFLDGRSVPNDSVIEAELCIVGAGAAGITLAREFATAGFRVALIESGALEIEAETQALYEGGDIGRPYLDLTTCRLRYYGGTTNHWVGWCLPLDAIDLEEREGLPRRGWPFPRSHLDPWYRRAQEICQLGPYDYAPARWGIAPEKIPAPFNGPNFCSKILQESPPTRFGPVYEPALRQAPRLTVYLNSNALGFDAGEDDAEIQSLRVATLAGNRFTVRARFYVAASGGIENARLLLLSGKPDGNGIGNRHDLVGRCFMTHLEYRSGVIAVSNPHTDFDFCQRFEGKQPVVSFVGLTEDSMRRLRLPNFRITWNYEFAPVVAAVDASKRLVHASGGHLLADLSTVIRDLDGLTSYAVRKALFGEGVPVEALTLRCESEQMPNPDSRVLLGSDVDALGLRKIVADWRVTAEDKRLALAMHRLLGTEIGRTGFGRLRSTLVDDDETWPEDFRGNEHHMGTTRMHVDPTQGVVDANCRVHGIANLYVAGSSVFATGGAANPTLTIVALALRLADHLKERLA
jgi:choline dehydrogenase-like flavoprotein